MILLGWNIWLGCQLLLGEYCQLIEDEGECSNFFVSSIDGLQVWKEDKCVKVTICSHDMKYSKSRILTWGWIYKSSLVKKWVLIW